MTLREALPGATPGLLTINGQDLQLPMLPSHVGLFSKEHCPSESVGTLMPIGCLGPAQFELVGEAILRIWRAEYQRQSLVLAGAA